MADAIPQGQSTGQGLADLFGGVNRPQLNAFVATSQARNGLVSAQTQDAMIKATQAQERIDAYNRIPTELKATSPDMSDSESQLARDLIIQQSGGDPVNALKALGQLKLGYGTPTQQTSGQQMFEGKLAGPVTTPNNYQMPAGSPLANTPVQQSPQGAADTANLNASAALHAAQAQAGGFNPHTNGAPLDPNAVNFGAYMLYKTGKMPSLGMGGGAGRSAIISGAAQLAQQEQDNPGSTTNPGFDTALANGQDFTAGGRALNSFAGGPLGNQARSINNVVGHLQLMENLFTGLQNGDVQIANKLGAQWKKAFGTETPTDIQTASSFIGPELTKILSANGSAGTAEERQEFSNTAANLGNSPEQTAGAIGTLKNMLGRQSTDLALQYHGATGRNDFVSRYVAPDVAKYLDIAPQPPVAPAVPGPAAPGANAPATPVAPPAPIKIQNDDDFNKLPSGALFIGPDGHTRKKP